MTVRLIALWMSLGVFAAFGLYTVKFKVQALRQEVARTETQLREAHKNMHVLTAEWTYLNRPQRLRQLSEKFLDDKPIQGAQLADFATLPQGAPLPVQPASGLMQHSPHAKGMTLASGAIHGR
jgi:hypothetical protein